MPAHTGGRAKPLPAREGHRRHVQSWVDHHDSLMLIFLYPREIGVSKPSVHHTHTRGQVSIFGLILRMRDGAVMSSVMFPGFPLGW